MELRFSRCSVALLLLLLLFVAANALRGSHVQVDEQKLLVPRGRGSSRFNPQSAKIVNISSTPTSTSKPSSRRGSQNRKANGLTSRTNEERALKSTTIKSTNTESKRNLNFGAKKTLDKGRTTPSTIEEVRTTSRKPVINKKGTDRRYHPEVSNTRKGKKIEEVNAEIPIEFPKDSQTFQKGSFRSSLRKVEKNPSRRVKNVPSGQLEKSGPSVFSGSSSSELSRSRTGRKIQTTYTTRELRSGIPASRRFASKRNGENVSMSRKEIDLNRDSLPSGSENIDVDVPAVLEVTKRSVSTLATSEESQRQAKANNDSRRSSDRGTRSRGRTSSTESSRAEESGNHSGRGKLRRGSLRSSEERKVTEGPEVNRRSGVRFLNDEAETIRPRNSDIKSRTGGSESRSRGRTPDVPNQGLNSQRTVSQEATRRSGNRGSNSRNRSPEVKNQGPDSRKRSRIRSRDDTTTSRFADQTTSSADLVTVVPKVFRTVASTESNLETTTMDLLQSETPSTTMTSRSATTVASANRVVSTTTSRATRRESEGTIRTMERTGAPGRRASKEDFYNHGLGFRGRRPLIDPATAPTITTTPVPAVVSAGTTVAPGKQQRGFPGWTLNRRPYHTYSGAESSQVMTAEESTTTAVITTKPAGRRGNKTFVKTSGDSGVVTRTESLESENYPADFKAKVAQLKNSATSSQGVIPTPISTVLGHKKSPSALFSARSRMKLENALKLVKPELLDEEIDSRTMSGSSNEKFENRLTEINTESSLGQESVAKAEWKLKPETNTKNEERSSKSKIKQGRSFTPRFKSIEEDTENNILDSSTEISRSEKSKVSFKTRYKSEIDNSIGRGKFGISSRGQKLSDGVSTTTTKPKKTSPRRSVKNPEEEDSKFKSRKPVSRYRNALKNPIQNHFQNSATSEKPKSNLSSLRRSKNYDSTTLNPRVEEARIIPTLSSLAEETKIVPVTMKNYLSVTKSVITKVSEKISTKRLKASTFNGLTKNDEPGVENSKKFIYNSRSLNEVPNDDDDDSTTIKMLRPTSRYARKKVDLSKTLSPASKSLISALKTTIPASTGNHNNANRREFRPRTATYRRHSEVPPDSVRPSTAQPNSIAITPKAARLQAEISSISPSPLLVTQEPTVNVKVSNNSNSSQQQSLGILSSSNGSSNIFSPTKSALLTAGNVTLLEQIRSTVAPLLGSLAARSPVFSGVNKNQINVNTAVRITPNGSPPRFSARYKGAELFVRKPSLYQPTISSITSSSTPFTPIENSGLPPPIEVSNNGEPKIVTFYQALESATITNEQLKTNLEQLRRVAQVDRPTDNDPNGTNSSNNETETITVAVTTASSITDTAMTSDITQSLEATPRALDATQSPENIPTSSESPTTSEATTISETSPPPTMFTSVMEVSNPTEVSTTTMSTTTMEDITTLSSNPDVLSNNIGEALSANPDVGTTTSDRPEISTTELSSTTEVFIVTPVTMESSTQMSSSETTTLVGKITTSSVSDETTTPGSETESPTTQMTSFTESFVTTTEMVTDSMAIEEGFSANSRVSPSVMLKTISKTAISSTTEAQSTTVSSITETPSTTMPTISETPSTTILPSTKAVPLTTMRTINMPSTIIPVTGYLRFPKLQSFLEVMAQLRYPNTKNQVIPSNTQMTTPLNKPVTSVTETQSRAMLSTTKNPSTTVSSITETPSTTMPLITETPSTTILPSTKTVPLTTMRTTSTPSTIIPVTGYPRFPTLQSLLEVMAQLRNLNTKSQVIPAKTQMTTPFNKPLTSVTETQSATMLSTTENPSTTVSSITETPSTIIPSITETPSTTILPSTIILPSTKAVPLTAVRTTSTPFTITPVTGYPRFPKLQSFLEVLAQLRDPSTKSQVISVSTQMTNPFNKTTPMMDSTTLISTILSSAEMPNTSSTTLPSTADQTTITSPMLNDIISINSLNIEMSLEENITTTTEIDQASVESSTILSIQPRITMTKDEFINMTRTWINDYDSDSDSDSDSVLPFDNDLLSRLMNVASKLFSKPLNATQSLLLQKTLENTDRSSLDKLPSLLGGFLDHTDRNHTTESTTAVDISTILEPRLETPAHISLPIVKQTTETRETTSASEPSSLTSDSQTNEAQQTTTAPDLTTETTDNFSTNPPQTQTASILDLYAMLSDLVTKAPTTPPALEIGSRIQDTTLTPTSTQQTQMVEETTPNMSLKTTMGILTTTSLDLPDRTTLNPTLLKRFQDTTPETAQGTAGANMISSNLIDSLTTPKSTILTTNIPTTISMNPTTTPAPTTSTVPDATTMMTQTPEPMTTVNNEIQDSSNSSEQPTTIPSTTTSSTTTQSITTASTTTPSTISSSTITQSVTPPSVSTQTMSTPYLGRFGGSRITPAPRFSSSSSTTAPLRDYLVYGIYPNKTIVRKRPEDNLIDARNIDSPYVIFGIYPDGRLVRKFPNGTVIPDPPSNPVEVVFSLSTTTTTTTNRPSPSVIVDNQANQGSINQNAALFNNRSPMATLDSQNGLLAPKDVENGLSGNTIGTTGPASPFSPTVGSVGSTTQKMVTDAQNATSSVPSATSSSSSNSNVVPGSNGSQQGGRIIQDRERDEATRTREAGGQRSSVYIGQDKFINYWTNGQPNTNPQVLNVKINSVSTAATAGSASSASKSSFDLLPKSGTGAQVTAPPGFPWKDPLDQIFGITTNPPSISASVASNVLDDVNSQNGPITARPVNPFAEIFTPISRGTSSATSAPIISTPSSTTSTIKTAISTPLTTSTTNSSPPRMTIPSGLSTTNMLKQNAFGTTFDDLAFLNTLLNTPRFGSTTPKTLTEVEQLLANKILSLALGKAGPTRSPKAIQPSNASPNLLIETNPNSESDPVIIDLLPSSTTQKTPATWKPVTSTSSVVVNPWKTILNSIAANQIRISTPNSLESTSDNLRPVFNHQSTSTTTTTTTPRITTTTIPRIITTPSTTTTTRGTTTTTMRSTPKNSGSTRQVVITAKPRPRTTTSAPSGIGENLLSVLFGGNVFRTQKTTPTPVPALENTSKNLKPILNHQTTSTTTTTTTPETTTTSTTTPRTTTTTTTTPRIITTSSTTTSTSTTTKTVRTTPKTSGSTRKVVITARPRPRTTTPAPLGFGANLLRAIFGGNLFGTPTTTPTPVRSRKPVKTNRRPTTTTRSVSTTKGIQTTERVVSNIQVPSSTQGAIQVTPEVQVSKEKDSANLEAASSSTVGVNDQNSKLTQSQSSTFSPEDDAKFLMALLNAAQNTRAKTESSTSSSKTPVSKDDESFLRAILTGQANLPPAPVKGEIGVNDAALLAALLKAEGIGPSTPANQLREQLQLAGLEKNIETRSSTTSQSQTSTTTRKTTTRPRPAAPTWKPSSTYPPPLFGGFNFGGSSDSFRGDTNPNTGEDTVRSQVVNAAIGVTRAFSQFLGGAIRGAAKQLQTFVGNGTRSFFS